MRLFQWQPAPGRSQSQPTTGEGTPGCPKPLGCLTKRVPFLYVLVELCHKWGHHFNHAKLDHRSIEPNGDLGSTILRTPPIWG